MAKIVQVSRANVEAYRAVRLEALQCDPTAFGSTYAREAQMTAAEWLDRVTAWDGAVGVRYVALEGERPCGVVGACLSESDRTRAHVVSMWVAPSQRRAGLGTDLIATVRDWGRDRGARELQLLVTNSNQQAMRFYERLGFARTGVTAPYPNDPALYEHEMIARIA